VGQIEGMRKGKGRKTKEQTQQANKQAREETSGLIDPRLRKALSHELRVQILTVANQREVSPSEFSEELDVPLSNVSYHFRKLLAYDCIELTREVPVRGSHEHRYVGTRRGLISDGDWAQLGRGTQAGVRIAGFQDLINRCTQAVEGETFDAREDAAFYWVPMSLDEIGWKKMQAAIRRIIDEVEECEVESSQRVADGESQTFPATFGVLGFESPTKPNWNRRRRTKANEAKPKGPSKSPKK
jgi:DNA-binding transcriptional ArsR family regulator